MIAVIQMRFQWIGCVWCQFHVCRQSSQLSGPVHQLINRSLIPHDLFKVSVRSNQIGAWSTRVESANSIRVCHVDLTRCLNDHWQMSNPKPVHYVVDYYYQKPGVGSRSRTQLTGSVSQHLQGATTESAVMSYLRKKHAGYEITLMSLSWKWSEPIGQIELHARL